ncbi:MAG: FimV/HubP-related protein [Cuniculiplasma sp.]
MTSLSYRQFAVALGTAFLLTPLAVTAATLGSVVVQSPIGQPLRAYIPVHGQGPVTARIAPRVAFRAAGLAPPSARTRLSCQVLTTRHGRVIRVTSAAPIEHPDVTFLVAVNTPHGSLVQEYHAALLPVLMPVPRQTTPRYRRLGPIHPGESLLEAARAMAPWPSDHGALMEALVERNPGAFDHDNANGLRVGAILHRPPHSVVEAISRAQALRFLRAQYTAWTSFRSPPASSPLVPAQVTALPAPPAHRRPAAHPVAPKKVKRHTVDTARTQPDKSLPLPQSHPLPIKKTVVRKRTLPAATLVAAGITGQSIPMGTSSTRPQLPAPTPPTRSGVPLHNWLDLMVLVIIVSGIYHWKKTRKIAASVAATSAPAPSPVPKIPVVEAPAPTASPVPAEASLPASAPQASAQGSLTVVRDNKQYLLKLDLARTYADIGESALAREILEEVRANIAMVRAQPLIASDNEIRQ